MNLILDWKKSQKKYSNSKRKRLLIIKRVFLVDSVVSRSKEKISKTSSNQSQLQGTNQKPIKNLQNQRSTVVKNQKNQNQWAFLVLGLMVQIQIPINILPPSNRYF